MQSGILSGVSLRIKQFAVSLAVRMLRLARVIVRALWWLLALLIDPFWLTLKFILKPIALFIYRRYISVFTRLKKSKFFHNKFFFIFGNKYLIHVMVVTITVFVASNNVIQAKTVYDEDFGKQSGLYQIASEGELGEEIVEKGLPQRSGSTDFYFETDGVLIANIPRVDPQAQRLRTIEEELQLLEAGSALTSNTVLSTEVGVRADFTNYKVREGDSIGSIADRFGLSVNSILWANSLTSKSFIKPGDTLSIPPYSGYVVEVKDGDTLKKLVDKHTGDYDATLAALEGEDIIPVGSKIIIVDGEPYVPPPPPKPTYTASNTGSGNVFQQRNVPGSVTGGNLNWPVGCRNAAKTYYGHGLARDIACPSGTPIYAAESGTAYIRNSNGWGGGYGLYIDVVHPNGMTTRYAHMSAFNISSGQSVGRGDVIGFVGSTGRSTGPHVHFEVTVNGVKQEPLNFIR